MKLSDLALSVALVLIMFAGAIYLLVAAPPGFEENFVHRLVLPFLLVSAALMVLENLRTKAHIGQLVGAMRALLKRAGNEPTPEVKAEAVEILLGSLRNSAPTVRKTAAVQLRNLTGQSFGEDVDAWEDWWARNKQEFKKKGGAS